MHEFAQKVQLQVIEAVEHDARNPNCIESSKLAISSAIHGYEAELGERLEEQAVWHPNTDIRHNEDRHQQAQPPQEENVSKVLVPTSADQSVVTHADHFLQDGSDVLDYRYGGCFWANRQVYPCFHIWDLHFLCWNP